MARLLLGYGCAMTTRNTGQHKREKGGTTHAGRITVHEKGGTQEAERLFVSLLGPEVGCGEGGGNNDECRGRENHQDQVLVSKYQK